MELKKNCSIYLLLSNFVNVEVFLKVQTNPLLPMTWRYGSINTAQPTVFFFFFSAQKLVHEPIVLSRKDFVILFCASRFFFSSKINSDMITSFTIFYELISN